MQYRIVCYGPRCVGYGPFDSEDEARCYAYEHLQPYRCDIVCADVPFVDTSHVITDEQFAKLEAELAELINAHDF